MKKTVLGAGCSCKKRYWGNASVQNPKTSSAYSMILSFSTPTDCDTPPVCQFQKSKESTAEGEGEEDKEEEEQADGAAAAEAKEDDEEDEKPLQAMVSC